MSGLGFISVQEPQKCAICGNVEETRPYGPNGENVCFTCGMKDEPACIKGFRKLVLGEETH
jgi:hypothetical protein